MLVFQTENGSPGIFLNPFTICSSCKRKFVVCPFVDKERNKSCLFANELKRTCPQTRMDWPFYDMTRDRRDHIELPHVLQGRKDCQHCEDRWQPGNSA